MKWVDYREQLGLGFSDKGKAIMLCNKIATLIEHSAINEEYSGEDYYQFCLMVGIKYTYLPSPKKNLANLFTNNSLTVAQSLSFYIAFVNTKRDCEPEDREELIGIIEGFLTDLGINYETVEDDDGWFIFPKGAKELDAALVSAPLDWLSAYPSARTAWVKALKEYSEQTDDNASDIADKFRKAMETFFQEFFGGKKSLENYKSDYGTYLKQHGIPAEISGNFETLLQSYANYINNFAKHADETSRNVLEYIMYQTGNIIRLLITLKGGTPHAD